MVGPSKRVFPAGETNNPFVAHCRLETLSCPFKYGKRFNLIHMYSFSKGIIWLSVLSVRKKLALLRRLGRWLAGRTRAAREWSLRLGCLNAAENPSGQSSTKEKSNNSKTPSSYPFFLFILPKLKTGVSLSSKE